MIERHCQITISSGINTIALFRTGQQNNTSVYCSIDDQKLNYFHKNTYYLRSLIPTAVAIIGISLFALQHNVATGDGAHTPDIDLLPAFTLATDTTYRSVEKETPPGDRLSTSLKKLESRMVHVNGGTFTMGCTAEQAHCGKDENPLRSVHVGSFRIDKFEVTQELWQAVMGDNPSTFDNCPHCPVETVSWDDIQAFLQTLNLLGGAYRLPSEAEWEFASRGGNQSRGFQYSGSNNWAEVAWYYENSDNRTNPVGGKKPNELGLFDMSGNVREWVQDCWHDSYTGGPIDGRAWEEDNCVRRVIRGGSWYGKPSYVRSANRFWYATYFRNNNLGFRIASSADPDSAD